MFCYKCGSANDDSAMFCSHCGTALTPASQPAQQPGNPPQQPMYPPQQPNYTPQQAPAAQDKALGMGWFKFLIYFSLFAGAVLNAYTAVNMLTGAVYGDSKDLVYLAFKELKNLDTIVGVVSLALAVLGVYTRFRLSGFHTNGPKMLLLTYAGAIAVNVIYLVGLNAILPAAVIEELDITSFTSSIVTSCVMIFVNNIYFKKRRHLFVNE